ncbi:Os08g0116750 [Oryza sativa Japonica Group]|uniref:Os08g0116750 protein n=1 Tax=Oryza sativa subsp. japonica TaxID=39947 RepID=A0A0P0XAZ7_ORYSJ|nr:hypothetical protein EE612_041799 [Oryza sativa]BAT03558.1 Os08g0116750 [Oryza sativa Japonica Group]
MPTLDISTVLFTSSCLDMTIKDLKHRKKNVNFNIRTQHKHISATNRLATKLSASLANRISTPQHWHTNCPYSIAIKNVCPKRCKKLFNSKRLKIPYGFMIHHNSHNKREFQKLYPQPTREVLEAFGNKICCRSMGSFRSQANLVVQFLKQVSILGWLSLRPHL